MVLVVNKGSRVEFEHLYVGITRVEDIKKYLRIVECESFDHLKTKSPPAELELWLKNYNTNGKWVFKGLAAIIEIRKKEWTQKIKTLDTLKVMYLNDLREVAKRLNILNRKTSQDCIEEIQKLLNLPTGPINTEFIFGKGLKLPGKKRKRSSQSKDNKKKKKQNKSESNGSTTGN